MGSEMCIRDRRLTAIEDFPDLLIVGSGCTRGAAKLDVIATNIDGVITETIDPLEDETGKASDHKTVLVEARLPRLHQYTTSSYATKIYSQEAEEKFGNLLLAIDWEIIRGSSSSESALFCRSYIMSVFQPLKEQSDLVTLLG